MTIAGKAVLITGADRGIGQALVEEALRRGARRVYAGARRPSGYPDARVIPVMLDVTDGAQIQAVLSGVDSVDVLVNNVGFAIHDDLSDRTGLEQHLAISLFGTYSVTQALMPLLARSHGAVVNVLPVLGLGALPVTPSYSVSKTAAFALTQALRALLAGRGVSVHAALTGSADSDLSLDLEGPVVSPESVARAIFDGVENGDEDIFPDLTADPMADSWQGREIRALERRYAAAGSARRR